MASVPIVQDDDGIGSLRFLGNDGANSREGAYIKAFVDGTPGTDDMPGRLVFETVNDGGSTTTVMPIDGSESRVGIGTTYPSTTLQVACTCLEVYF